MSEKQYERLACEPTIAEIYKPINHTAANWNGIKLSDIKFILPIQFTLA